MRLAVYGTLRLKNRANEFLKGATFSGETRVPGFDMYNLGGFPGVIPNPDNKEGVVCEIFENVDADTLRHLDVYEGYYPTSNRNSNFVRKEIEVEGKPTELYVFNHTVDRSWYNPIPSGDWSDR